MTELYRRFDPQTRRLAYVVPSAAGGTIADSNAVRLHFIYDNFNVDSYKAYIVFDAKTLDGDYYTFSKSTEPSFDGKTFVIPNEVMARVKGNRLGYQLVFIQYDANTGQSTEIHSLIDYLQAASSIDVPVSTDEEMIERRLDEIEALIRNGDVGQLLIGQGVGVVPVWGNYLDSEPVYLIERDKPTSTNNGVPADDEGENIGIDPIQPYY